MPRGRALPDETIGRHVLVRELGRGGMGVVYLARDVRLDRQVAIKLVSVAGPAAIERFLSEARVTARCKHPNIVDIYEIDDEDGHPYMVLEYVEGESAHALVQRGPVDPARVLELAIQVARGLAFAHSRGIVHRDLKPANILVSTGGVAKIADFGIAKPFDAAGGWEGAAAGSEDGPRDLTATSELPGTLHYLAPEQARREPSDDRADLWAFGVTLYHLLAGRRPLEGLPRLEVLEHLADLDRELPRLETVAPATPPSLVDIVHRCVEKRLELRMASAVELLAALEAIARPAAGALPAAGPAAPPATAAPSTTAQGPPVGRGRRRRSLTAVALVAAVIGVTLMWAAWPRTRRVAAGPAIDPTAVARVEALLGELGRLDGRGQPGAADQLLASFLADEPDAHALALAWLVHGDRARARTDAVRDAAVNSYATAYARAADPGVQRRALLALAGMYLDVWAWDRLAAALAVLDELPGAPAPEVEALRARLRLAVRDGAAGHGAAMPTARIARAVLFGQPTDLNAAHAIAVDADGDGDLDLVTIEGDDVVARAADTRAELARHASAGLGELRCAGRDDHGAYVVAAAQRGGVRLVPLDGAPAADLGALVPAARGSCRAIDLDGAGGDELYLFGRSALIRVTRRGERWDHLEVPLGSEPWDAVGGDLDGDGRRELVLSVGEWRGYEVRLVRLAADGSLRIHDRVRLGVVTTLADLGVDGAGRGRIAAIKLDVYPNARDLPADRPLGARAGLYVIELAGDRLRVDAHVPLPGLSGDAWHRVAPRHFPNAWPLLVGDVDGDGHRDLIADIAPGSESNLVVMLADGRGGFAAGVASGIAPYAVIESDGDGAAELVVRVDGSPGIWILGDGDRPIPARPLARSRPGEPAAGARVDRTLASAWRRGEQLARIGQIEAGADALRRVAALLRAPGDKLMALRRAGELLAGAGLPAGETQEAIAQLPEIPVRDRVEAWLAAIEDDLAHSALRDGRGRVARLRTSGLALDPTQAARLARASARLPGEARRVFGDGRVDAAWRVADPSLVHVPPGARTLSIETLVPGVVASLPLTAGAEGVAVSIEAEVTGMEWASNLVFRLGPRGAHDRAHGAVTAEIGARGGGRIYRRGFACRGTDPSAGEQYRPLEHSDEVVVVRIELTLVPGARRGRCAMIIDGRPMALDLDVEAGGGDAWELSIGAGPLADQTSARARITSIEIAGAMLPGEPRSDLHAAALALVGHRAADARAALARLDSAVAATWPARRMAIIAAEESGDRRAAVAAVTAALAARDGGRPSLRELASLARVRDGQFMPVLRAAFGPRVALLLAAAWTTTAHHDLDEPRVRAALLRDLDRLPPATAETRDATLSLLGYLGEALMMSGRQDEARRALQDALALAPSGGGPPLRDRAERIAYLLAIDAAARGDEPAARRWALASIERSNYPEHAADLLLLDPSLQRLAVGPGWERVRDLGRSLTVAP